MIKITEESLLMEGNLPDILSDTAFLLRVVRKKAIAKLGPELGEALYQKTIKLAEMETEDMEKELKEMEAENSKLLNKLFFK